MEAEEIPGGSRSAEIATLCPSRTSGQARNDRENIWQLFHLSVVPQRGMENSLENSPNGVAFESLSPQRVAFGDRQRHPFLEALERSGLGRHFHLLV